jgi:hypothetical protein
LDQDNQNNAFLDIVKKAMPDKIIANFIIVAEMVDGTNTELSIFVSESMTPWLATGMLQAAMDLPPMASSQSLKMLTRMTTPNKHHLNADKN